MISKLRFIFALIIFLFLAVLYALLAGSYDISPRTTFNVLMQKFCRVQAQGLSKMDMIIAHDVRLLSIITAILVGFALSVVGVLSDLLLIHLE